MRFLASVLLWCALFALLVGAAVAYVDPRGEFGRDGFPKVTLDARRQKLDLFAAYHREAPVTGLILGSSRSMKIDPSLLDGARGLRYFNFTVDAARAEDYLALYRYARAQGAQIRDVLIGLDIEALHGSDRPFVNHRNNAQLRQYVEDRQAGLVSLAANVSRAKELLTTSYLRDTARVLIASRHPEAQVPFMQFTKSGYLHYPGRERQRAQGTFDLQREIAACVPNYLTIYGDMTAVSARRLAQLETLVREVEAGGGRVTIWLTPLQVQTVDALSERTHYRRLYQVTRTAMTALVSRTNAAFMDFSRAERFGATEADWYDCAHIDDAGAAHLVRAVLEGKASASKLVSRAFQAP